jgi:hypothetical protein
VTSLSLSVAGYQLVGVQTRIGVLTLEILMSENW